MSTFALWLDSSFAAFDLAASQAVHGLAVWGGGFFTPLFQAVSFLGKGGVCLLVIAAALLLWKKTRRAGAAMLLGIALGALVTNLCVKPLVARARPYAHEASVYYGLWQTVARAVESDMSFPSGHTTAAAAFASAAFFSARGRLRWLLWLFPLLMGLARLYLVVHYATDVLAGLVIGTLAGFAAAVLVRRRQHRKKETA